MIEVRGNRISMIFQQPQDRSQSTLKVADQIAEVLSIHQHVGKEQGHARAVELLEMVGIPDPERRAEALSPPAFRRHAQRVVIAMGLACVPDLFIADEPTTALDVTMQAQILDLMLTLRQDYDTAIMIITHDLGVISEIASRVVVMYAGRVVEAARTVDIFKNPKHPYTRGLLQSIPKLGERARNGRRRLREIAGMVPSLYSLPEGCHFYPRCPDRMEKCGEHLPESLLDTGAAMLYGAGCTY